MITLKDVRLAVNRQLTRTGVEINSRDVKEGFIRPSFFVQFNNVGRHGTEAQIERTLIVNIYYFPTDRYEYAVEVLDVQETLENLFDLKLRVKDRYLNVDNLNTFVNDGILNCTFELEFFTERDMEWETDDQQEHLEQYPVKDMEVLELNKE